VRIRVARAEFAFESVRSREYREEELVRLEPRLSKIFAGARLRACSGR